MRWQFLRSDPLVCNGRVHIAGTRITARRALEALALHADRAELAEDFPELTEAVIREVLNFAALQLDDSEIDWPRAA